MTPSAGPWTQQGYTAASPNAAFRTAVEKANAKAVPDGRFEL